MERRGQSWEIGKRTHERRISIQLTYFAFYLATNFHSPSLSQKLKMNFHSKLKRKKRKYYLPWGTLSVLRGRRRKKDGKKGRIEFLFLFFSFFPRNEREELQNMFILGNVSQQRSSFSIFSYIHVCMRQEEEKKYKEMQFHNICYSVHKEHTILPL